MASTLRSGRYRANAPRNCRRQQSDRRIACVPPPDGSRWKCGSTHVANRRRESPPHFLPRRSSHVGRTSCTRPTPRNVRDWMNSDCCFVLVTSHARICLCCNGSSDTVLPCVSKVFTRRSLRPDWRRENVSTCNQWWVSICAEPDIAGNGSFSQVPPPACPVMCDTVQNNSLGTATDL